MAKETEIEHLDLRYERYRMKNSESEARLLASIAERGIEEPLEVADPQGARILLNGFKRYRCARKLSIGIVPYTSLGADEAAGILNLLRVSNTKSLSILEQAGFVQKLHKDDGLCVSEIARLLSRSKGWVSMRLSLMEDLPAGVKGKLFKGTFPVYSYMYTLRPFMRMNGSQKERVEQFVAALSGKKLSVREIEQLAQCCFKGPESLRAEILKGNVTLPLERMRQVPPDPDGCSEFERGLLKDFELTHKYMRRIMGKLDDRRLKARPFFAQSNLLTAGVISIVSGFTAALRRFHERSGDMQGDFSAAPKRDGRTGDRPEPEGKPQHGEKDHPATRPDA